MWPFHKHIWINVGSSRVAPVKFTNNLDYMYVNDKCKYGFVSFLFQCSFCSKFKKVEILGNENLEEFLCAEVMNS